MDIHERFELVNDDYLKFDRIENKKSNRPDLNAFILLDEIWPGSSDMVCAAEHDEIYLAMDSCQIEELNDEQVLELVRCGVRHSNEYDCLVMFVESDR